MHLSLSGCVLAAALLTAGAPSQSERPVHHLAQVQIRDAAELDRLMALDLDLAACTHVELPVRVLDVIVTDADLVTLGTSGLKFDVAIRNLEDYHAREAAKWGPFSQEALNPPVGQGGMGGHYTLAQMESILDSFANAHPGLCTQKVSIGRSIEGRDIWMVKISDNVAQTENEPRAFYDAIHHAREPVSMTATLQFMDWLLSSYGSDPVATFIVDERELYFVPCLNPDGYEYNRRTNPGGGGLWRKNRRRNSNGSTGVDLNRNYATGWSAPNGGNSTNPSSDIYRGPRAFSEPESTAVNNFITGKNFANVCSTHTYTDVLLRPWGWQNGGPSNSADYSRVGAYLTQENGIQHGSVSGLLYIAAGGAVDHHHQAHGALSWTPELGRSNEGGFWPSPPNQVNISNRHQPMFRKMALVAGAFLSLGDVRLAEAAGGNGNGTIEPGESGSVTMDIDNNGLAAAAGGVTLTIQAVSAGVTIQNGQANIGSPGRLSSTNNNGAPLRFGVDNSAGPSVTIRVTMAGGGITETRDIDIPTVAYTTFVSDDMEVNRGFARGPTTATTGRWALETNQRTTNQGRTYQPGTQHTPGGRLCWVTEGSAGSSVGANDVDSGYTDLVSPTFDLSHVAIAELSFWRWYAESVGNDPFEVFVSRNGGSSWTRLQSDSSSTNAWVEETFELGQPLTNNMVFRFRAQDLNASLVEALVDDFALTGVAPAGSITALGSGAIGTTIRIGTNGASGAQSTVLMSPWTSGPTTIPGIGGVLNLNPVLIFDFGALAIGSSGHAAVDVPVPNDVNLRGADTNWQALYQDGATLTLSNLQSIRLR